MKAPGFWFLGTGSWAQRLLSPAGLVYGRIARRRFSRKPQYHAQVPVICVGNPTVGGAGKTPTCLRVARMIEAAGRKPVFLTRGYGGSAKGSVLVEPRHTSADVGDEALLLAAAAPTVVSADRVAGAKLAAEHGDIVVMDDGFQNPSLFKDLSLLVIDGEAGIGNGRVFPAGPLRLPLDAQLKRADAVLIVGSGSGEARVVKAVEKRKLPILRGRLRPTPDAETALRGRRVFAFAGIGRPEKFFASLAAAGAEVSGAWAFADHHPFTVAEANEIMRRARKLEAVPATTEKDAARLRGDQPQAVRELREAVLTLPVEMDLDDELGAGAVRADRGGLRRRRRGGAGRRGRAAGALRLSRVSRGRAPQGPAATPAPGRGVPSGGLAGLAELEIALHRGVGIGIGLLLLDAPVAQVGERNARAGHRAGHVGPGPHHAVVAVEILQRGLALRHRPLEAVHGCPFPAVYRFHPPT